MKTKSKPSNLSVTQTIVEDQFTKKLFKAISGLKDDFFDPITNAEYRNNFLWIFAGIIAKLSPEPVKSSTPLNITAFINLLKTSSIKRIAEVGPGSPNYSMIFPVAKLLYENEIEMTGIGADLVGYVAELFRDAHVQIIQQNAGELTAEKLNLDLIIAKNVFSIGGQYTAGQMDDDDIKIIEIINNGVLDLIRQLSDNPNAIIILTESFDILPIDRKIISQEVDILCWRPWQTGNAFMYRHPDYIDFYEEYPRSIFENSANFIVLRKKVKL